MSVLSLGQAGDLETWSRIGSPIHHLDARSKTITTLLFMITVMSFPRYELSTLMPLALYPVVLLTLGNIPTASILKRVALAAPVAIMIGAFNPIFDTQPMLHIAGRPISGGWLSFASILLRYVLTLTAMLALVACTGILPLCSGLARLGLPRAFALQILFLYRYLFVVAGEGERMRRGATLRLGGNRLQLSVFASLVGHLLIRSLDRAQRIYRAMLARGFDGSFRQTERQTWTGRDTAFVVCWSLYFLAARQWNLAAALGQLTTGRIV